MDQYYSFIFRGILTDEALDKAGRSKKLTNDKALQSEIVKRLPFEILDNELVSAARRMATVYTAICAFENSLRLFVSKRLIEEFKEDWWQKGVPDKVRRIAESRKNEEDKIKWHSQRGGNLTDYTEFRDIESIIIANWKLFEPHVQTQDWVKSILNPLERSRNVLMHGGQLEMQDIERIGTLIRDWISQAG